MSESTVLEFVQNANNLDHLDREYQNDNNAEAKDNNAEAKDNNADTEADKNIDIIYNNIKNMLGQTNLNASNIIFIATRVIDTAEKIKKLSGLSKKIIVMGALRKFINTQNLSQDEKSTLLIILDTVVDNAIDVVVDIKKNKKKLLCC